MRNVLHQTLTSHLILLNSYIRQTVVLRVLLPSMKCLLTPYGHCGGHEKVNTLILLLFVDGPGNWPTVKLVDSPVSW